LEELRLAPMLTDSMIEEMRAMRQNNVDSEAFGARSLFSKRKPASVWCEAKLDRLAANPKFVYNSIDRRGSRVFYNTQESLVRDRALVEDDVYYDELNRRRSLFDTVSCQDILNLRVGSKVVATNRISKDIPVGSIGTVIEIRQADSADEDLLLEEWELPWGTRKESLKQDWLHVDKDRQWPYVQFHVGKEKFEKCVVPVWHVVDDDQGTALCSRLQLPLLLAYGLTVHRAQGMSIERCIFHVTGVFAYGQAYSAVGRGCAFETFRILGENLVP